MKKAAVIIDKWKLPIFSKHLREAGYSYDTAAGLMPNTHTLTVSYEVAAALVPVIQAAQDECAKVKP